MKINYKNPPRSFKVGVDSSIILDDMGEIYLESNQQITFISDDKKEYDVCRKEWGYYATPSVNDRLKRFGFKTALVKNSRGQLYIMVVEKEKLEIFQQYLIKENNQVVIWLDEISLEI